MALFENFITFGVLLAIFAESTGYFSESPLNTMTVKDQPVTLRCSGQPGTAVSDIHWDFKPYTGSENTTSTRRVVTGCVSLSQNYNTSSGVTGQCYLKITSLKAYHAGRYTCVRGNESAAAQLGVVVLEPGCVVSPPGPYLEGQSIRVFCMIHYAGNIPLSVVASRLDALKADVFTYSNTTVYDADPNQVYAVNELYTTINMTAPRSRDQNLEGITFKAVLPINLMGSATNDPSYKFDWNSDSLNVLWSETTTSTAMIQQVHVCLMFGLILMMSQLFY